METSDWNKPNAEAKVVLRYTAALPDGTVFEERGEGNELTFAADEGALCTACGCVSLSLESCCAGSA